MNSEEFADRVEAFADGSITLLSSTLKGEPSLEDKGINKENLRAFFRLTHPITIQKSKSDRLNLGCAYRLCTNSTGRHLAVESSSYAIRFKSMKNFAPIVRFEYDRNAHSKPSSHFHFHADSTPLGMVLARAGEYDKAVHQQNLHFPMGSERFRVCLEDIVELLIDEFKAESQPGWKKVLQERRSNFHQIQVETIINKNLEVAARLLSERGYKIDAPAGDRPLGDVY